MATAQRARRFVRLTGSVMQITEGKAKTRYRLEAMASDWGMAFRCAKVGGTRKSDNDGAEYATCIDPIEGQHYCGCPSFEKSGTCRHCEALLALLAAGRLAK